MLISRAWYLHSTTKAFIRLPSTFALPFISAESQINNAEAVAKLKDLARWLYESAEMKQEKNLKRLDVDRYPSAR
jgi:hypothetical protein